MLRLASRSAKAGQVFRCMLRLNHVGNAGRACASAFGCFASAGSRWNESLEMFDCKSSLRASLPYGSTTSMPEPRVFGAWTSSVEERVHAAFSEIEERNGRIVAVLGGHGDLEVQVRSKSDGVASLSAVTISGFRIVRVPASGTIPTAARPKGARK